jgi:hypothetical protein
MIADIPFTRRDTRAVGKFLRRCVIAAIVGDNGPSLFFQFQADRLAYTAGSAGNYRNAHPHSPVLLVVWCGLTRRLEINKLTLA